MAIISSYGALTAIAGSMPTAVTTPSTSGPFYDGLRRAYGQIYRTQPEVRTCVDFFSRNISQLGLHAFRRVADDDRLRLSKHPLASVIRKPNPSTTRYRIFDSTIQDYGIYWNAYWLKIRTPGRLGLVRLPAAEVAVKGRLLPTAYEWTPDGGKTETFAPSEIVHFRGYDPTNPSMGLPPLETLRRVLAESSASGQYREQFWKHSARTETAIVRPKDAPKWVEPHRTQFREDLQQFAGSGAKAGQFIVLEDGMEPKPMGWSAKEAQYLESVKLSREVVAAAYHIPLPMVGILDHATFSNIKEQHKQLYQDCLGPTLTMIEEDIELQLLPEFDDVEDVYVEFNLAEKLKGSFEEQATGLQQAIGRPWMTPNEGRARVNLPRDSAPESDRIATVGQGQASPAPSQASAADVRPVVGRFAARQQARLDKDGDRAVEAFQTARWDLELARDLTPTHGPKAGGLAAIAINRHTLALLEQGQRPWTEARIDAVAAWLCEQE